MASKYDPLTRYLASSRQSRIELSFSDIELILGQSLATSARTRREWWANSGHQHASVWTSAGYRVYRPDLPRGVIRFIRSSDQSQHEAGSPTVGADGERVEASFRPIHRHSGSKWAVDQHLVALNAEFERYLNVCEERRIFSGPSVYFYEQTIEQRRKARSLADLAQDKRFHESVYATLTSWGMHRMGETVAAKLTDFGIFSKTLQGLITSVKDFAELSITEITEDDFGVVAKKLAPLAEVQGITASKAPLVANSKTLHFVLPNLVPPMDRTYTGRFFFGPKTGMLLPGPASKNFVFMFTELHRIAQRHAEVLKSKTGRSYICLGHAKGLDNAIIGYVLSHPRFFPRTGGKKRSTSE